MPETLPEPKKGEPIAAEWGRTLVKILREYIDGGPEVVSPLVKLHGAIGLGQEYQLFEAITTATIDARSGSQWGSGPAKFVTASSPGVESLTQGLGGFTAWNWTGGAITFTGTGVRIWVCWSYDKWVIIAADCSGVGGAIGSSSMSTGAGTSVSTGVGISTGTFLSVGSGTSVTMANAISGPLGVGLAQTGVTGGGYGDGGEGVGAM